MGVEPARAKEHSTKPKDLDRRFPP